MKYGHANLLFHNKRLTRACWSRVARRVRHNGVILSQFSDLHYQLISCWFVYIISNLHLWLGPRPKQSKCLASKQTNKPNVKQVSNSFVTLNQTYYVTLLMVITEERKRERERERIHVRANSDYVLKIIFREKTRATVTKKVVIMTERETERKFI